ncbi:MAG: hypothetical protein IT209_00855 [Armatimonadetes bacterium]|nr:hypothetical protein [Armatimonadota bacterium]
MAMQLKKCPKCQQTYYVGQPHACPETCQWCGQVYDPYVGHLCPSPPKNLTQPLPANTAAPENVQNEMLECLRRIDRSTGSINLILRIWFWICVLVFAYAVLVGLLDGWVRS